MKTKPSTTQKTKSLVELRQEGLREIHNREGMQAHGKFMGMDTFSWWNPQFENLATVLTDFPFNVTWVGSHEQIRCAVKYFPEVLDNIETVIIHDSASVKFKKEALKKIKNVAGVGDDVHALKLLATMSKKKQVLLFTADGPEGKMSIEKFRAFIAE